MNNNKYKIAMDQVKIREDLADNILKQLQQPAKYGFKYNNISRRLVYSVIGVVASVALAIMIVTLTKDMKQSRPNNQQIAEIKIQDPVVQKGSQSESIEQRKIVDSSKYNGSSACYKFLPGARIISSEVKMAMKDPINIDSFYYVSIYMSKEDGHNQALIEDEHKRLSELGYKVYLLERNEEGESYLKLTALLTNKQLEDFPTRDDVCYIIEWVRDENGIVEWAGE